MSATETKPTIETSIGTFAIRVNGTTISAESNNCTVNGVYMGYAWFHVYMDEDGNWRASNDLSQPHLRRADNFKDASYAARQKARRILTDALRAWATENAAAVEEAVKVQRAEITEKAYASLRELEQLCKAERERLEQVIHEAVVYPAHNLGTLNPYCRISRPRD